MRMAPCLGGAFLSSPVLALRCRSTRGRPPHLCGSPFSLRYPDADERQFAAAAHLKKDHLMARLLFRIELRCDLIRRSHLLLRDFSDDVTRADVFLTRRAIRIDIG